MLGPRSDEKSGRVSGRFGRGKEERGTVGGAEGGATSTSDILSPTGPL